MDVGEDGAVGPSQLGDLVAPDMDSSVERSQRLATLRKRKQRCQHTKGLKRPKIEEQRVQNE